MKKNGIKGVYFLKNNTNELIKIGCSKNIKQRIKEIEATFKHVGVECDLNLISYVECIQYGKLEHYLHTVFVNDRIQGEWFSIEENVLIDYIKQLDIKQYNIENIEQIEEEYIKTDKEQADEICDTTNYEIGSYVWCLYERIKSIRNTINNDKEFVKFYYYIFNIINSKKIENKFRPEILCSCFDIVDGILFSVDKNIYNFNWETPITNLINNKQENLIVKSEETKKYWNSIFNY